MVCLEMHILNAPAEDGDGGYRAMRALIMADIQSDKVDYANAHSTSTKKVTIELNAISDCSHNIFVSSTKSSMDIYWEQPEVWSLFSIMSLNNNIFVTI